MTWFLLAVATLHGVCLIGTLLPPRSKQVGIDATIHTCMTVCALALLWR